MTLKKIIAQMLLVAVVAVGSVWIYTKFQAQPLTFNQSGKTLFQNAKYTGDNPPVPMVDFQKAATKAAPAVVHIKTVLKATQTGGNIQIPDPFKDFFGPGP